MMMRQSGIEILRSSFTGLEKGGGGGKSALRHAPVLKASNKLRVGAGGTVPEFYGAQTSDKGLLSSAVKAYAANSHRGNIKPFNEDRISIVTRLSPDNPDVSVFAVYDGHGGQGCAEFLRENVPAYILRQECLRADPEQALKNAFREAEEEFMRRNELVIKDRSGSCACLVMVVGDNVYLANVGDSRAIISSNEGNKSSELTRDHKPSEEGEKKRIT